LADALIPLQDELRRRIAAARGYADGMSQDKLAKAIGVGKMTIVRTERGDRPDARKEIPVDELRTIARVTGLGLEFFLTDPAQLAAVGPSVEERLAALEAQVATLAPIVASSVSLEGLEAEQRQFLQDWQRRSSSTSSTDARGSGSRGEG
jgi:transcriptional regulator with XRE-family HTH domain